MIAEAPTFPPLLQGEAVRTDPFAAAQERAAEGCDAGLVLFEVAADRLRAAMIFAPEVPLSDAMAMLPLCAVGFQNALGAIAPPEVAVHLGWDGGLRVNGGLCGQLRVAAAGRDPGAVPDWLVIGLDLALWQQADDPGATPDRTSLWDEGCAEVDPVTLLEAWARHTLVWINRWSEEGNRPVHAEWSGLAWGMGKHGTAAGVTGHLLGIDERFGLLVRDDATTHLVPLTALLTEARQ